MPTNIAIQRLATILRESRQAIAFGGNGFASWVDADNRAQVAREWGMAPATLKRIEAGEELPAEDFIRRYTPRLGCDAERTLSLWRLAVREHRRNEQVVKPRVRASIIAILRSRIASERHDRERRGAHLMYGGGRQ